MRYNECLFHYACTVYVGKTYVIEYFSAVRDPAICDHVNEPRGKYKLSKPDTERKILHETVEKWFSQFAMEGHARHELEVINLQGIG